MRIYLNLTPNQEIVPFDYQHILVGKFHKWLGSNEYHDKVSLYSLSWLNGGEKYKNGLSFKDGAKWFISFWDESIGKQLIFNAMKDTEVLSGMYVNEITISEEPNFSANERLMVSSPVLVRKYDADKNAEHLTYKDVEADFLLTETMKRKLLEANLDLKIAVKFDRDYPKARTKLVDIKGIKNKASLCPIILEGDSEAIKFAWNVGVGHSTGSGFGSIF